MQDWSVVSKIIFRTKRLKLVVFMCSWGSGGCKPWEGIGFCILQSVKMTQNTS